MTGDYDSHRAQAQESDAGLKGSRSIAVDPPRQTSVELQTNCINLLVLNCVIYPRSTGLPPVMWAPEPWSALRVIVSTVGEDRCR